MMRTGILLILISAALLYTGCVSLVNGFGPGRGKDKRYGQSKESKRYYVKKELAQIDTGAVSQKRSSSRGSHAKRQFGSSVPFLFNVGYTFDGKPLFLVQKISFSSPSVTIHVWDDALEDGDIITLYLNDRPIVSNYRLKNQKHSVQAQLVQGKTNTLYLYAHNLGEYPPNTAAIQLETRDESRNFVLSSTLESSQGVEIEVR